MKAIERMVSILKGLGIKMSVDACDGCIGPYVLFEYAGEVILTGELEVSFNTEEPPKNNSKKLTVPY